MARQYPTVDTASRIRPTDTIEIEYIDGVLLVKGRSGIESDRRLREGDEDQLAKLGLPRKMLVDGMDLDEVTGKVTLAVSDPNGPLAQTPRVIVLEGGAYVAQHRNLPGYRGPLTSHEAHTSVADALITDGYVAA